MTNKQSTILFSGIQPTGDIHIGNYLGALRNWVDLQDKYQSLYCIVDLHALTITQDPTQFANKIRQTAIDLLAIGLNPKKATIFVQSHVPAHSELAWLFTTLLPLAELERMTQFKDKSQANQLNINAGLLQYPVLMAADILLYHAEAVPVGDDQVQHIELTNTIVRKFNNKYGLTFQNVKPLLTNGARIMSLTDPQKKMSKSLGPKNYIALRDKPEVIKEKIAHAVTDSGPEGPDHKSLGVHNLFELLELFADQKTVSYFEKEYNNKTIKYSVLKEKLADSIIKTLSPIQENINKYEKKPKLVDTILKKGAQQANKLANKNIIALKEKMGLY